MLLLKTNEIKRKLWKSKRDTSFFYKQSKIYTIALKIYNLLNNLETICQGEQETKIKQSTARTG